MASELQSTKYSIPAPHGVVARSSLFERLFRGFGRRLTLVCAPAGFGKTTLVADWIRTTGTPAAWLSAEESDNDTIDLLSCIAEAIKAHVPRAQEAIRHLGGPLPAAAARSHGERAS